MIDRSGGRHHRSRGIGGRGGKDRGRAWKKNKGTGQDAAGRGGTTTTTTTTAGTTTLIVKVPETTTTTREGKKGGEKEGRDDADVCWIVSALKALGHEKANDKGNIYDDGVFQEIVVFLEDRCIRLWELAERDSTIRQTANFFETHLATYLQATGCPYTYDHHHHVQDAAAIMPEHRIRVLHWLVCCAIKEVYIDTFDATPPLDDDDDAANQPSDPSPQRQDATDLPAVLAKQGHGLLQESCAVAATTTALPLPPIGFPLGFSTGDDQVDAVLTSIRMQMIVDMQEHQHIINERVIAAAANHHRMR
jgi:hypothetical protein